MLSMKLISICKIFPMKPSERDWFSGLVRALLASVILLGTPSFAVETLRYSDHPLAGRIWSVAESRYIDVEALKAMVSDAEVILLGESHTNPIHHAQQNLLLQHLAQSKKSLALVMEMLNREQQSDIPQALVAAKAELDAFDEMLGFSQKGWEWPLYRELINTAVTFELPVVAANLSRETARGLVKQGMAAMPETLREYFSQAGKLDENSQHVLIDSIRESHCGMIPEPLLESLALAQRARDVSMAAALIDAEEAQRVLIAGAQHVRKDYGVAQVIAKLVPELKTVTVAMRPVEANSLKAGDYSSSSSPISFDYVWFTARQQPDDPCSAYRDELKKSFEKNPQ